MTMYDTAMPHDAHHHGPSCNHDHGHSHAHSHGHSHGGHGHHHHHHVGDYGRAFIIGIALNSVFIVVETVCGIMANSLALLADASHNLSDVLGLVLAWGATILSKRAPTARFTYGLRGSAVLAALANAVLLLVVTGGIIWEAAERVFAAPDVEGFTVIIVAGIGILINGVTAWLFVGGKGSDINIKGAYLHMLADALVSAGVVVVGLIIMFTGFAWLDPVVSIGIALVIIAGTWSLLKESLALSMQAVPEKVDPVAVRTYLTDLPGVTEIHDLHIWPIGTQEIALSAHLVMPQGHPGDAFLCEVQDVLQKRFAISHATMQIEIGDAPCHLAPESVV
jgi:cobalt-zinc-cadmium efflux system protein